MGCEPSESMNVGGPPGFMHPGYPMIDNLLTPLQPTRTSNFAAVHQFEFSKRPQAISYHCFRALHNPKSGSHKIRNPPGFKWDACGYFFIMASGMLHCSETIFMLVTLKPDMALSFFAMLSLDMLSFDI